MTRPACLITAVCYLFAASALAAQVPADPLSGVQRLSDFAVPDAPAMKLITIGEGAILRPQSFGTLSVGLGDFRGPGGQFIVPQELGLEFSPTLLASRAASAYQPGNSFLHRTRLSIAAKRDSGGRSAVALGVRWSAVEDADLSSDSKAMQDFQLRATSLADSINRILSSARSTVRPPAEPSLTPAQEQAVAGLQDQIRTLVAAEMWNANAVHFAVAARASSLDTLGTNPRVDEVAVWGTVARRLGTPGQLLIGLQAGSSRDSTGSTRTGLKASTRSYYGTNAAKAFLEATLSLRQNKSSATQLAAGIEFRIDRIGWIDAQWGMERTGTQAARSFSTFKLKRGFGWP